MRTFSLLDLMQKNLLNQFTHDQLTVDAASKKRFIFIEQNGRCIRNNRSEYVNVFIPQIKCF